MQGTHIPETNYVPREHGVAAILLFLFMVLISFLSVLNLLYFYISTLLLLLLLLLFIASELSLGSTLVQTKQIRINIHKGNNTNTQYKHYKTQ